MAPQVFNLCSQPLNAPPTTRKDSTSIKTSLLVPIFHEHKIARYTSCTDTSHDENPRTTEPVPPPAFEQNRSADGERGPRHQKHDVPGCYIRGLLHMCPVSDVFSPRLHSGTQMTAARVIPCRALSLRVTLLIGCFVRSLFLISRASGLR